MKDKYVPYNCSGKEGRWVEDPMTPKEQINFLARLRQRGLRKERKRAAFLAKETARQLRIIHERRNLRKIAEGFTPPSINDVSKQQREE